MYPCTTGAMCVKEAAKFSIRFLVFNQNYTSVLVFCAYICIFASVNHALMTKSYHSDLCFAEMELRKPQDFGKKHPRFPKLAPSPSSFPSSDQFLSPVGAS
jgi:hypothetical protein